MVRTAIIMGMVGHLDDDDARTIERVDDAGYRGVELGCHAGDDESILDAIEETGLDVTSVMTGLGQIQSSEDELLPACRALGVERVVLGWLDESYYESPAATRETAELLNDCVDGLAEHGLTLCYHNHDHEFATFDDGRTAFDVLVEHLDDRVQFEFDVGWVGTGGADPVEVVRRHGDRTPLVHLKDMDFETGESVRLGEGDLDVAGVVDAAEEAGVEWLVYEHEQPDDAEASMREAAAKMNDLVERDGGVAR